MNTLTLPILSMAHRIAGHGTAEGDPVSVPADRWRPLLGTLVSQRLTGLAVAALEAGELELTQDQGMELLARQREAMLRALATERTLLDLSATLSRADISCIVLKGPALAHTVYPEPEWRPFGDLDLLVRGRDWASARSAVESLGFRRNVPEPRPGFDVRFGKAATHSNADGLQVDLHRTLVLGPFGLWIEPEDLFSATTEFRLGGHRLLRLDDEALFLHACVHASLGWAPPLLLPVRDVVQIGAAVRLDRRVIADRIRAWRLAPVVAHALQAAEELLGEGVPALDGILEGIEIERGGAEGTPRVHHHPPAEGWARPLDGAGDPRPGREGRVPSRPAHADEGVPRPRAHAERPGRFVPAAVVRAAGMDQEEHVNSRRQEDSDVRYRRRP